MISMWVGWDGDPLGRFEASESREEGAYPDPAFVSLEPDFLRSAASACFERRE